MKWLYAIPVVMLAFLVMVRVALADGSDDPVDPEVYVQRAEAAGDRVDQLQEQQRDGLTELAERNGEDAQSLREINGNVDDVHEITSVNAARERSWAEFGWGLLGEVLPWAWPFALAGSKTVRNIATQGYQAHQSGAEIVPAGPGVFEVRENGKARLTLRASQKQQQSQNVTVQHG